MKKYLSLLLILMMALTLAACGESAKESTPDQTPAETPKETSENTSETAGKSPSSFDEKCLDEYGNPTMYALTELTGPELVKLLEEQGYQWIDNDDVAEKWSWFERAVQLTKVTS